MLRFEQRVYTVVHYNDIPEKIIDSIFIYMCPVNDTMKEIDIDCCEAEVIEYFKQYGLSGIVLLDISW